jgi:undecaprenyl-diphosphatase
MTAEQPTSWKTRLKRNGLRIYPGTGAAIALLLLGSVFWIFMEVADEVIEGEIQAMDTRILLSFREPDNRADPIGPLWVEEVIRDSTALGGFAFLTFLVFSVAGTFFLKGKNRLGIFLLGSVAGGLILSQILKAGFDRPRPDLVPHLSHVSTGSFPSGHSTMAAVVFCTLGALLAYREDLKRMKVYFISLAGFLTGVVGFSRVYLGVHWPSDVAAGWALGIGWATASLLVYQYIYVRKRRNTPGDTGTEAGLPNK